MRAILEPLEREARLFPRRLFWWTHEQFRSQIVA
jgi:hypothetical protein